MGKKTGYQIGVIFGWGGLILVVLGLYIYNKSLAGSAYPYPTIPFVDPEQTNPASFLVANGTYHPNPPGNREGINGTVTNHASHTNYKDIHIKVNFISQTNSIITTKEYILNEYVPYGATKAFSLAIDKPAATASCGWVATGATATVTGQ